MRFALAAVVIASSPIAARAERPMPTSIWIEPRLAPPVTAPIPSSKLVYMHRCPPSGCIVTEGLDDSRINRSSIAQGQRSIGGFSQSDAVWDGLVACVTATYAPFDITIVDVDPGNVPHYEHMVGGVPSELRNDIPNAGGVAPFDCDEIPNAISYTFDVYGSRIDHLCWTASQEIAHAFGLEHELDSKDPLTYLDGPLPKRFQASDVPCGTYAAQFCACTGNGTQNSYKHILDMFGPGAPTPPTVSIRAPTAGKLVQPGFVTRIDASDDVAIERVELWIDNMLAGEDAMAPYALAAPETLELGPHTVEARAIDVQGVPASEVIEVELGPPCTAANGCSGGDVCVLGNCVPGPSVRGGLGSFCTANSECASGQCVGEQEFGAKYCVETCDVSLRTSCPDGFDCLETGDTGVCWRSDDSGCCSTGGSPAGAAGSALGVLVVVLRRRRRR